MAFLLPRKRNDTKLAWVSESVVHEESCWSLACPFGQKRRRRRRFERVERIRPIINNKNISRPSFWVRWRFENEEPGKSFHGSLLFIYRCSCTRGEKVTVMAHCIAIGGVSQSERESINGIFPLKKTKSRTCYLVTDDHHHDDDDDDDRRLAGRFQLLLLHRLLRRTSTTSRVVGRFVFAPPKVSMDS